MKLKPVNAYAKPRYPELNRENEESVRLLLKRQMPARWKRLAASAAMLCATAGIAEAAPPKQAGVVAVDAKPAKDAAKKKAAVTVAPLAPEIAAYGRGSFGCVAVSPPIYLSEDEAKEIIFDELKNAGIHLGAGMKLVRKPATPPPDGYKYVSTEEALAYPERQRAGVALSIDWADAQKGVAVELLTVSDGRFWGDVAMHRTNPERAGWSSSAYRVDLGKGAALMAEIVASFENDRNLALGIFAVPLITLTQEERQTKSSFYADYHAALNKAAPFPNLKPGSTQEERKEAYDAYNRKRNEFMSANKAMLDEANRKNHAYLKEIGKDGEPLLRAQVKHFVKWLEEQEKSE